MCGYHSESDESKAKQSHNMQYSSLTWDSDDGQKPDWVSERTPAYGGGPCALVRLGYDEFTFPAYAACQRVTCREAYGTIARAGLGAGTLHKTGNKAVLNTYSSNCQPGQLEALGYKRLHAKA